ncbi:hypothetical protein Tco_0454797 [Tanacetum coccineum]
MGMNQRFGGVDAHSALHIGVQKLMRWLDVRGEGSDAVVVRGILRKGGRGRAMQTEDAEGHMEGLGWDSGRGRGEEESWHWRKNDVQGIG